MIKGSSRAAHKGCTEEQQRATPGCASFVKWATQLTWPVGPGLMSSNYDRGGQIAGGRPRSLYPPNGQIRAAGINAIRKSYGHDCP